MHIGSTQDHTKMAAGLSLLSVGCFPNQSALLHCGPSIKDSHKQLKHRISFQEIYFFCFSWLIPSLLDLFDPSMWLARPRADYSGFEVLCIGRYTAQLYCRLHEHRARCFRL